MCLLLIMRVVEERYCVDFVKCVFDIMIIVECEGFEFFFSVFVFLEKVC